MEKKIDIHHHLIFGMDDGAADEQEMQRMADAAHEQGVEYIFATPHAYPGRHPFNKEKYNQRLAAVNEYCRLKNYGLRVLTGAEMRYFQSAVRALDEGEIPTLNNSDFVLVEWSSGVDAEAFYRAVREISNAGYIVIVAHIERCRNLRGKLRMIGEMKDVFDMRVQVDCDVFLERGRWLDKLFVHQMMKAQLVDFVASDAHDTQERRVQLEEVLPKLCVYGEEYARRLLYENQLEIIDAGDAVPV